MGKLCLHTRLFIFDRIVIKVAGNQDKHKSSDKFDFWASGFHGPFMFFEIRFDLSTLDSSERMLPFGLLVLNKIS